MQRTTDGNTSPKDFYCYMSSTTALAGDANANDAINIQADSDFILYKLAVFAIDNTTPGAQTSASRVLPIASTQITDTGSGRQIFEQAIPIPALFGDGSLPFILPAPRRFASNSVIAINYANLQATISYDIHLLFIGVKVYVGR